MKTAALSLVLFGIVVQALGGDVRTPLAWPAKPDPSANTDWIVSVTIQEKWEEQPNRQFTLAKTESGYEAWTKTLMKSSGKQTALTARTNRFSSTSCLALKTVGDSFGRIRISPIPQEFMALHPMVYEFWVATRYGEPRIFKYLVPNGSYWGDLGENPPELVSWVNDALRKTGGCQK